VKHPLYLAARQIVESYPVGKEFTVYELRDDLAKKSRGTAQLMSSMGKVGLSITLHDVIRGFYGEDKISVSKWVKNG
jgi:hypothetical protein